MAVGARPGVVQLQFLCEAMLLSLIGGGIGVLGGMGAARVIQAVAGFTPEVSVGSIVLAFGVSCAIGIFFWLLPRSQGRAAGPY